ncbi:MAG: hypothetical protein WC211_00600 [Dehalococcoidia bacterium]
MTTPKKRPAARAKRVHRAYDDLPVLYARVDHEIFASAHRLAKDARQSYTQWLCSMIESAVAARARSRSALAALHEGESGRKRRAVVNGGAK